MLRKLIAFVLLTAVAALPLAITGCDEPNEYKSNYQREITVPVQQGTVVE